MLMTRQEIAIAVHGLDRDGAFLTEWRKAHRDEIDPYWWRRHLNEKIGGGSISTLDDLAKVMG